MGHTKKISKKQKKVAAANVVGNVMEWYDFALYGYFASILAPLFFPGGSQIASLLETFGAFAAGFLMRPLGGALFGYIGDTFSRRKTMLLSVIFMAVPTTILGLLPTYAQIGVFAPLLLVITRLVQGLSVGGEFSGSVTYVAETAPLKKRGFLASFANVGGNIGMLMGVGFSALITALMAHSMVMSWGWRLPFLFGALLGLVGVVLRHQLAVSEVFEKHEKKYKRDTPFRELIKKNKRELGVGTLFAAGYGVFYYIAAVYLPTYLHTYFKVPLDKALIINSVGIALLMVATPTYGFISDRYIKRKYLLMIAFITITALSYPLFALLMSSNFTAITISQIVFLLVVGMVEGTAPAFFTEMFKTGDRLTGYSLSFNLGMGILGGATPMISTWLIKVTGLLYAPAIFLMVAALMVVGSLFFIKDHSRESLLQE